MSPESNSSAAKLMQAFTDSLHHGLSAPSVEVFSCLFPNLSQPVIGALMELYGQVLAHAETNAQVEFKDVCCEYGMQPRLQHFDEIFNAASEATSGRGQEQDAPCESILSSKLQSKPFTHFQHQAAGQNSAAAETFAHSTAGFSEQEHLRGLLLQVEAQHALLKQNLAQRNTEAKQLGLACKAAASEVQEVLASNNMWYGSS